MYKNIYKVLSNYNAKFLIPEIKLSRSEFQNFVAAYNKFIKQIKKRAHCTNKLIQNIT